MFCDYAKIKIKAGRGGDGCVSFLRDINKPRGGPDGGDGGKGGNVIFRVDSNINTLSQFLRQKEYCAEDGKNGQNKDKTGRDGRDLIINVPLGTVVYEIVPGKKPQPIHDFYEINQQALLAEGGRGGYGNARFSNSTRQAPKIRELGLPGEKKKLILELKIIADIGLVGLPNSGKSTFLKAATKARPKIADYPFTTLIPNLGVINYKRDSLTVADIPGLIEGASRGKGLGHDFLRHIERTRVILHFIDIQSPDPDGDYLTIRKELKEFSEKLAKKPEIICFTKIDTTGWKIKDSDLQEYIKLFKQKIKAKKKIYAISAITKQGLDELIKHLFFVVNKAPKDSTHLIVPSKKNRQPNDEWRVNKKNDRTYVITGEKISKIAAKTDFDSPESLSRFISILSKFKIDKELIKQKIKKGDNLLIGKKKIIWE